MTGLMAFELRVAQLGEPGGGQGGVVEPGVGGEGGGELADEVAEGGAVEAEETAGADEEVERVGGGPAVEGERAGVDPPASVRAAAGGEGEGGAVVEGDGVRGRGGGARCAAGFRRGGAVGRVLDGSRDDDLLVRELGEGLREQPGGYPIPALGGEFGGTEQGRPGGGCGGVESRGAGDVDTGTPRGGTAVGGRSGAVGRRGRWGGWGGW
ncbi:non-ribosomal peptide synthetase [Streptomyces laurentii]|uniref:Non-ribosomal peptide synthetase n=1 Tax=Streptomyces laurentii TaxID=39478 RepID=A0A169P5N0_STRLU|nr:non-ribosomal peptide synthetase [Streptomyces laurentii]